LLREGRSFLAEGRGREASLRFSRVLLEDPSHAGARRGEARAQALLNEEDRLAALRLEEARGALAGGRVDEARAGIKEAPTHGADPVLAPPLLDRLAERGGRLTEVASPLSTAPTGASRSGRRSGLPRTALVVGWAAILAVLLSTVLARWERIVDRLTSAPLPASAPAPPVSSLPPTSPGEAALQEARRLLSTGETKGALRVLDRIPAEDPAYPYARRVRAEAEATLAGDSVAR
jgi:hypothetical protein